MKKYRVDEMLMFLKEKNIHYEYVGDMNLIINGFSSLNNYKKDSITWVKNKKNWNSDYNKNINIAVVQKGIDIFIENQLICDNSKEVFFMLLEEFFCEKEEFPAIGLNTVIGKNVEIGTNVIIGNNCTILGNIHIGDNTVIGDNVVIKNNVYIGDNCEIQSLTVVGEDGFGYYEEGEVKTMIKHYGGVNIGNNVFIGMHVNIARGTIDDTKIEDGVKIAPFSHIGHNGWIKKNTTIICSQLYGSVQVEQNAYIVGSTIRNQCKIGRNSFIGMGSVVTKDIKDNKLVMGVPAKEIKDM